MANSICLLLNFKTRTTIDPEQISYEKSPQAYEQAARNLPIQDAVNLYWASVLLITKGTSRYKHCPNFAAFELF